jgi:hypothetical protein
MTAGSSRSAPASIAKRGDVAVAHAVLVAVEVRERPADRRLDVVVRVPDARDERDAVAVGRPAREAVAGEGLGELVLVPVDEDVQPGVAGHADHVAVAAARSPVS